MRKVFLIIILIFVAFYGYCQDTPYKAVNYSFINQDKNLIHFCGNSSEKFKKICLILNNLIVKGNGQLKILQIGDSHIQADYFSGKMRENMQSFAPGIKGNRGFIFPYRIAKTNNPENYKSKFTGNWHHKRNITENNNTDLGISGISVTTYDTNASVQIILNNHSFPHQDFNKVKIFQNSGDSIFDIFIEQNGILRGNYNNLGFTEFATDEHFDTLNIFFLKSDSNQKQFTIHGIELDNDDPGIIYSAVGINGAECNSFLKCNLLENHLQIINPEWIIISLGTNEAYSKNFSSTIFENNLDALICRIQNALPETFILLTTPPDSYRKRKKPNPNMQIASKTIYKIAEKRNCAVWDLYEVMGGFTSMKLWLKAGLAANDKIHFSTNGYALQGDLLFNAFLSAYDKNIDSGIK